MTMRITGMNSGLDTESIITELVKAKSEKKNDLVKAQTKLQWKQDAWKELNSKVYSFYTKTLSNIRFKSDYYKKTTKVSDESAASVITGTNAVNGVQTLEVEQLAKSGYLTGAALSKDVTSSTLVKDLYAGAVGKSITVSIGSDADNISKQVPINITDTTTIADVVSGFKDAGLNASFDEKTNRFFVSSKETGAAGNFEITCGEDEDNILNALGLNYHDTAETDSKGAHKIDGQNAKILLNGAEFESDTNTFEINGLTITANKETTDKITLTTADDTDGIYDMIKNFFTEYNTLINEMDKLYNADSSKGYEPLTDEEKEAMSEKEIEKWEEKIKDSILRRDSTLSSVSSAMKQVLAQGVKMSDGSQVYLSEFGIGTLGYFTSKDNEKNAYHIDGDPDDSSTSTNADKLKTAIANDPDKVVEFFSSLSMNLYNKLGDLMKKTEYSSSFTLYDDIAMKDEYKDYTSKISDQEQLITDYEDRYYKKFSAMETAMAKLQSKESAISGLLGM